MKIQKFVNGWFLEFLLVFLIAMICLIVVGKPLSRDFSLSPSDIVAFCIAYSLFVVITDELAPARRALIALAHNLYYYPKLFTRVKNKMYNALPDDVQAEIAVIAGRPMSAEDAKHLAAILEDYICDACGKLQSDCTCDGPILLAG